MPLIQCLKHDEQIAICCCQHMVDAVNNEEELIPMFWSHNGYYGELCEACMKKALALEEDSPEGDPFEAFLKSLSPICLSCYDHHQGVQSLWNKEDADGVFNKIGIRLREFAVFIRSEGSVDGYITKDVIRALSESVERVCKNDSAPLVLVRTVASLHYGLMLSAELRKVEEEKHIIREKVNSLHLFSMLGGVPN